MTSTRKLILGGSAAIAIAFALGAYTSPDITLIQGEEAAAHPHKNWPKKKDKKDGLEKKEAQKKPLQTKEKPKLENFKIRKPKSLKDVADAAAAAAEAESAEEEEKWDVNNPPGEKTSVEIDVDEGTWMSLDVSPDGKTIAFDLLGDIYTMSASGGEAIKWRRSH